jgi:hypothetical protein
VWRRLAGAGQNRSRVVGFTCGSHQDEAEVTTKSTTTPRHAHGRRRRPTMRRGGRRRCTNSGERTRSKTKSKDAQKWHQRGPHLAAKLRGGSSLTGRRQWSSFAAAARLGLSAAARVTLGRWDSAWAPTDASQRGLIGQGHPGQEGPRPGARALRKLGVGP